MHSLSSEIDFTAIRFMKFIIRLLLAILLMILGFFLGELYRKNNPSPSVSKSVPKLLSKSENDITLDDEAITQVDYGYPTVVGSPLIFGGAHAPVHPEAWNSLGEIGVTAIRRDFFIEFGVPGNISLDEYRGNMNGVADPKNWNWKSINENLEIFRRARNLNMKTIGIVAFAPFWLTHNGSNFGIPVDWEIYRDVVGKYYRIFRPYLDYVEIWNEPNHEHFLREEGSGYSVDQAYFQIFTNAYEAIRSVDIQIDDGKIIPIGGPVLADSESADLMRKILANRQITDNLDFISYHNYGKKEPSWNKYKSEMKKYNIESLPVFITEWNIMPANEEVINDYIYKDIAISAVASRFVSYLNMGLEGANYFSTTFNDLSKPNTVFSSFGFYRIENGEVRLLPQAKAWQLMSKTLGLGAGDSQIYYSHTTSDVKVAGFTNSKKENGLVIVNESNGNNLQSVLLRNLPGDPDRINVTSYLSSSVADGNSMIDSIRLKETNGIFKFYVNIPAQSVVGILVTPVNWWDVK